MTLERPIKSIRPIRITNTMTGEKEVLQTRVPGHLSLYSCGPTVYGFIHIGNLRGGLVADMFARYFTQVGYQVNYVRNYTDVDDKIIKRGIEEATPPEVVAKRYTLEAEKDYAVSGMMDPTHKPCVTTHISEIISMVETLISKGIAYPIEGGDVFYSIEKFSSYGKLSHKPLDDLIAGIRVDVNEKKRSPLDFVLWKLAKPGEPSWDSPWGRGRPGWHIECSAMSSKWIGNEIDIHHGGEDLIFPHHENEIAQSEGASGHAPFVRYWVHHAFLTLSKTKMSKSLGNVFTARDFLTKFSGEFARYLLLGVHYRSMIDFDENLIEQTLLGLQRIYEAKLKAVQMTRLAKVMPDPRAESIWGEFMASCEKVRREVDENYANDFNTAGALASVFTLIREFNRVLGEPLALATPAAILGSGELIRVLEVDLGNVLGVGRQDPEKALADLMRIKAQRSQAEGTDIPKEEEILRLLDERKAARAAKNFLRSDEIRNELDARGVLIKDSPQGVAWQYK